MSAVWALDEFTSSNGATEIVPGSHLLGEGGAAAVDQASVRTIEMSAGSAVLFFGTTLHRGGANRSDGVRLGITPQYCEPWIRQIENMASGGAAKCRSVIPSRVRDLLYGIYPPFIGYVDGRDPRRLFEPTPHDC